MRSYETTVELVPVDHALKHMQVLHLAKGEECVDESAVLTSDMVER